MLNTLLTSISILIISTNMLLACVGGTNNIGLLTPTALYQTTAANDGDYFTMNVVCGNQYNFDFCANGGSAGSLFPEITILDVSGTTELTFVPYPGGCSTLNWVASFTGTIRILITDSGCIQSGSWSGTMAYNETSSGPIDPSFTLAGVSCSEANSTIIGTPGGVFSFNPVPGDAAAVNTSTGAITNGTPGASYTLDYTICGSASSNNVTLSNGNASFSYTTFCGGGTATISGDTGGTFSFNPNPGDGAQISSTSGIISNGTAGTTYYADYTVCGATTNESVTVLTDNCWSLNGDAQFIDVNGEQCIQLTDEINSQTGCSWNSSTIDFNQNFTLTLDYYFGNNINGADGNTFTFQPSSSSSCGVNGQQLGAGSISNALVIEFDTYDNGTSAETWCDHIAIEIDGDMTNSTPLAGPICAKSNSGNIDDGQVYTVDIEWIVATQTLNIYFDGGLRLSTSHDFVNNVFGGQNNVYWGATSATGGLNNQQFFCPSTVVVLPIELGTFNSNCNNNEELFQWTTLSENNVDYFVLEYTYDNFVFQPAGMIDAIGNSQSEQYYSHPVNRIDIEQRYYRLKVVDGNGDIEYTDIIAGQNCDKNQLITKVIQKGNQLIVQTSKSASVELTNKVGQTIFNKNTQINMCVINKDELSNGLYFIRAIDKNGEQETQKAMIIKQ